MHTVNIKYERTWKHIVFIWIVKCSGAITDFSSNPIAVFHYYPRIINVDKPKGKENSNDTKATLKFQMKYNILEWF